MSGFSSSSSASFDCISHHNIQSYGFCEDFVLNLISKQYKFNQSAFFSKKKKRKSGGKTKGLYFYQAFAKTYISIAKFKWITQSRWFFYEAL